MRKPKAKTGSKPTGKRPVRDDSEEEDEPQRKRTKTKKAAPTQAAEDPADESDGDDQAEINKPPVEGDPGPAPPADPNADAAQDGAAIPEEDLRQDDAVHSPDSDVEDIDNLAEVQAGPIDFTLTRAGTDVTLRFRLQVFQDPAHTASRLFYRLRVFLTRPGEAEAQEAGYIHAYRISRSNGAHRPRAENAAWIREFMPRNIAAVPQIISETAHCLRALFTLDGAPSAGKVRDARVRQSLADEALLFVEMIHIRRRYQRQGLLTPALAHWQRMLQELPEWFAFSGNTVLVPGKPNNDRAARVGAGRDDVQVEAALTAVYRGQGFEVWSRNAKVGDSILSVMGTLLLPM